MNYLLKLLIKTHIALLIVSLVVYIVEMTTGFINFFRPFVSGVVALVNFRAAGPYISIIKYYFNPQIEDRSLQFFSALS